ncbi:MAG: lysophospholipid acyltransferase family protein [Gammaproteobacteria bacterium]
MILFRSILYFLAMTATVIVFGLTLSLLGWLLPWPQRHAIANAWGDTNLWLQRVLCGLSYRLRGAEHLPRGPSIVMAKHQSAWETISLRGILRKEQSWVLKRELLWIPVFGWALRVMRPIAIDRKAGRRAAREIVEQGLARLAEGRTIVIFPEGTRTAPGERRKYGIGGGLLAERARVPVIPIAHNAGVFWKRRGLKKYPGTIDVVVGPPIDTSGKKAAAITREVEAWIEGVQATLPETPGD